MPKRVAACLTLNASFSPFARIYGTTWNTKNILIKIFFYNLLIPCALKGLCCSFCRFAAKKGADFGTANIGNIKKKMEICIPNSTHSSQLTYSFFR